MTRHAITSDKLPAPVGPFSLGVNGGGLLFLSGQVAQERATGKLIDGDAARQTDQILRTVAPNPTAPARKAPTCPWGPPNDLRSSFGG